MESAVALLVAFFINVAVISVTASVCYSDNLSDDDLHRCNLGLSSASFLLKNVLGRSSSIVYSIALLASGQSSAITGTYAGQFIMQMILSFELPFALIPLLKFSSGTTKMGPHHNSLKVLVVAWVGGMGIIGINVYYLITAFIQWLLSHRTGVPFVGKVLAGVVFFPTTALYIISIIYLIFRPDLVVTFVNQPSINHHFENTALEPTIP